VSEPTKLESSDLHAYVFVKTACGVDNTAIVTKYGDVFTCGVGANGRLGHGNVENLTEFKKIEGLLSKTGGELVTSVECGSRHTLLLTDKGSLLAFGQGCNGQLGHYDPVLEDCEFPVYIPYFKNIKEKQARKEEKIRLREERYKQFRQF